MKPLSILILATLSLMNLDCKRVTDVSPVKDPTPFFNQVNIAFDNTQLQCLTDQWYRRTYKNEQPIAFRVINDASAYATLFPCNLATSLPVVNFATSSLLIGMKADYGEFINTPVNISQITQTLTPTTSGNYTLQVRVAGQASKDGKGGEWFAFAAVVPKVTGTVSLTMNYQFN